MPAVSKGALLVPGTYVRYRPMPSGGMLVNLATGACFELNRVGADLWTQLAAGATVGNAIEGIRKTYDAEPEIIASDALRLFGELLDRGLVDCRFESEKA